MGFTKEDFEKHAYNGPVYNTIDESITKGKGSQKDLDRKLRLSKKFFCFGLVTFCIGFLMIGFAIGCLPLLIMLRLMSSKLRKQQEATYMYQTVQVLSGTTRTEIVQLLRELQAR